MASRTVVVPFEARRYVIGVAHVVTRRVGIAPQDVDNSFFEAMHLICGSTDRSSVDSVFFSHEAGRVRRNSTTSKVDY